MVLDNLAESLRSTLRKIANATHVDKNLIKEVVKEIQRALLQADVNVKLVLALTKEIERRALEETPPSGRNSISYATSLLSSTPAARLPMPEAPRLRSATERMS